MNKRYYLLIVLTGMMSLSFSAHCPKKCHIYFNISTKFKITEESENGDHRVYSDSKNSFRLVVDKIKSKHPEKMINDSMNVWVQTCQSVDPARRIFEDTLEINNISIDRFSYSCDVKKTWNETYIFPTKSHLYKMHFAFSYTKSEKGRTEMERILNSLEIECD